MLARVANGGKSATFLRHRPPTSSRCQHTPGKEVVAANLSSTSSIPAKKIELVDPTENEARKEQVRPVAANPRQLPNPQRPYPQQQRRRQRQQFENTVSEDVLLRNSPLIREWLERKKNSIRPNRINLPSSLTNLSTVTGGSTPPNISSTPTSHSTTTQETMTTPTPPPPMTMESQRLRLLKSTSTSSPQWIPAITTEIINLPSLTYPVRRLAHDLVSILSKQGTYPTLIESLLHRLIAEEDANPRMRVSGALYTMSIDAWAKYAALLSRQQQQQNQRLIDGGSSKGSRLPPINTTDRPSIETTTTTTALDPPQRAENILQLMHNRHTSNPQRRAKPNVETFTAVLDCWAKSQCQDGPKRAKSILSWMDRLPDIEPNVYTYTSVIDAYAKRGMGMEAEEILMSMLERMRKEERKAEEGRAVDDSDGGGGTEGGSSNDDSSGNNSGIVKLGSKKEAHPFRPNVRTFTAVIGAHGSSNKGKVGAQRAESIFRQMQSLHDETSDFDLKPNVPSFTALILAWARSNTKAQGMEARRIFDELREMLDSLTDDERRWDDMQLTTQCCNTLLYAYAKSPTKNAPEDAERVLNELMLQPTMDGLKGAVPPNDVSWSSVAQSYAIRGDGEKAESLMRRFHDVTASGLGGDAKPSWYFYNNILNAWSKSSRSDAADRALSILDWMERRYKEGYPEVKPDVVSYSTVLTALSRSKDRKHGGGAPKKALEVLRRLEDQYQSGNVDAKPNVVPFLMTLTTLAKSQENGMHGETIRLLGRMEELHESGIYGRLLSRESYNVTLASCAWNTGSDECGADEAEKILDRMERSNDDRLQPNSSSYDYVIAACARSKRHDAASRAYKVLERMEERYRNGERNGGLVKPTSDSYNFVLTACSASEEEGARDIAKRILLRMEEQYKGGDTTLKPSTDSFRRILGNMARGREKNLSASAAEDMIILMDDLNKEGAGNAMYKEVCYTYALTICAWSKDDNAAKVAERILHRMEDHETENGEEKEVPKARTKDYNLTLIALSKCGDDDAVERAERIYRRMTDDRHEADDRNVAPDVVTLNSLLEAHANSKRHTAPERMEELIEETERQYMAGKTTPNHHNDDVVVLRPNTLSYDLLLQTWATSKRDGAAQRAHTVLRRMDDIHKSGRGVGVVPNLRSYSNAILACALTPGGRTVKLKNLQLALETFKELRTVSNVKPNNVVYNKLLQCGIYLSPVGDAKTKVTTFVFRECCQDGMLDSNLLKHYLEVAPDNVKEELFGRTDDGISMQTVPVEWSRNVKTKKRNGS